MWPDYYHLRNLLFYNNFRSLACKPFYMALTSGQLEKQRIRQQSIIQIADLSKCYYCKSTGLKETDKFCPNCAFPQRGTQGEMKKFLWNIRNKKKLLEDQRKAINKARNILYILAGLNLLLGILMGIVLMKDASVFIACVICAIVYALLGLWSTKNPFPAILTGFFFFIVIITLNAIVDPSTIMKGIIWKGIIIYGFVYGYKGVKKAEELEKELKSIKTAVDLNIPDEVQELRQS